MARGRETHRERGSRRGAWISSFFVLRRRRNRLGEISTDCREQPTNQVLETSITRRVLQRLRRRSVPPLVLRSTTGDFCRSNCYNNLPMIRAQFKIPPTPTP